MEVNFLRFEIFCHGFASVATLAQYTKQKKRTQKKNKYKESKQMQNKVLLNVLIFGSDMWLGRRQI